MSYQDFYQCADRPITQHSEFERYLKELLFKKSEREDFYRRLLAKNSDVSCDTFKDYFEQYAAERKSNKQDYTPNAVAELLSILTNGEMSEPNGYTAYDPTAGTGSLIIKRWYADMMQETIFSYAPHRYFYLCEELADNAIPYLLHNLALRGMNAIVIHGNTLEREAKQVYFVQNSKDDCMCFSDINVMPHSKDVAKEFNIQHWLEPEIKHIESGLVIGHHALPMQRKPLVINTDYEVPQKNLTHNEGLKLGNVATLERVKKNKIYRKGTIIVQLSATKGQVGLLESDGKVGTQYAAIDSQFFDDDYLFLKLQRDLPRWVHRVQEGLNIKLEDLAAMPL